MTDVSTTDRIERAIVLKAPRARVWKALTDHKEFGAWFLARLDTPFVEGQVVRGQMTYPGYEHMPFEAEVVRLEPERENAGGVHARGCAGGNEADRR
jgi:uncharacterized protein YndB with AHSA1/START domain